MTFTFAFNLMLQNINTGDLDMEEKGCRRKGFFGETIHYDANEEKICETRKDFLGGYDHYDTNGNKTGHSHRGLWGRINHYNSYGNKVRESTRNF